MEEKIENNQNKSHSSISILDETDVLADFPLQNEETLRNIETKLNESDNTYKNNLVSMMIILFNKISFKLYC